MAADAGDDSQLLIYRERVTRTLRAALAQGRLTEDEYDERIGRASASRSRAELAALTADLPAGRMDAPIRPPTAGVAWVGVSVIIAAAGVVAAVLLTNVDSAGAFLAFLIAAVTLLVAPIVTVGVMIDVRHQRRSGRQVPLQPAPRTGGTPAQRPASAAPAEPLPPIDPGRQQTAEAARSDPARRPSPGGRRGARAPRGIRPVPDAT
ncbi:MAG TPA: DUF1707 domain-containing protein [Streptosporangiaceae bacterium]|nr:DUF1707 domain-containing protein [Streptosporangiaceae bacterium]